MCYFVQNFSTLICESLFYAAFLQIESIIQIWRSQYATIVMIIKMTVIPMSISIIIRLIMTLILLMVLITMIALNDERQRR